MPSERSPRALRRVLRGGPRLVLVPMPRARTAAAFVHLRVGSRYESGKDNGISHFLEHMLHRGTTNHPSAHEQALAFERIGATLSAATYADHGVLSVAVPPASLEQVLELLAEVCRAPLFDAIDVERGIVREEILESLDARGRRTAPDDLLRELAFPSHPLGYPITGTLKTLARFDRALLRRCHRRHYTSELVVTVAGRFSSAAVARTVAKHFRLPAARTLPVTPPRFVRGPTVHHVRDASSQTALRFGFRAPGLKDANETATELLLRVIDDGTSTRLYHRLCDERGLCYDVSALYEAHEDVGLFEIAADSSHGNAVKVAEEIVALCRELKEQGPSPEELAKARARMGWQLESMLDSPADLAAFHGFAELFGVAHTPSERLAEFARISPRAVQEAARRVLTADALSLLTVGTLGARESQRLARAVALLG
jgi:predicted Zn-dependent peptidase